MVITAQDIPLKQGYKQTEVGAIPEDWEVRRLGDVAPLQRGFDLPTSQLKTGDYPVVYSNGVLNHHSRFKVKSPGVVTGRSGTIGKVTYIEDNYWPHNTSLWVTDFKGNLPKFIYYVYTNIKLEQVGTGSGVPTLNRNDVHTILIPLPPLPEQRAIASALSDVDALITSLDQLIAKKRDIKQATMQQLLTGRTRLPGFSGEWEVKKLGDVVDFLDGRRKPVSERDRAEMRGEYPYYGASGIVDYVDDYIFDEELILLGEDGENILSRNSKLAFQVAGKIWVNNHAHVLRPKENIDITFLTEYLESLDYEQYNTGTAQPKLNKRVCFEITVFLPSLPEQRAIAIILSDMDAEIAALEQRREKTRALKQGMMQELLTGKTRLR